MKNFTLPDTWKRNDILVSSLLINFLAMALPVITLQLYDRIIPRQAYETFFVLMLAMLGVVLIDFVLQMLRSSILSWESARFDHQSSLDAMALLLNAETQDFENKPAGFYMDRIQALEKVQEFYSGQSILLLMDFPFVMVFLVLIWMIAGQLLYIPLVLLAVFLLVSVMTGKKLQQVLKNRSLMEEHRQNFIIETLQGIHTIKAMAMESFMLRRYEKLQFQSAKSVYQLSKLNSIVQGIGATFSQLSVISFVGIGSVFVVRGDLTVGALAAGTMLTSRVLQPGLKAMGVWIQFQTVHLSLKKVNELFSMAQEPLVNVEKESPVNGAIELQNVCFKYPGQKQNLIDHLSLEVKPGESIGITGENGVGKSTLINLMAGFLRPESGKILLDGCEIKKIHVHALRSQIAIVPQYGVLIEGSILENMTMYREGVAKEQAVELANIIGLEAIISRMPEGLDTYIGGASMDNLPEGVKQKIIMVRSLIGHPQVILFDDANANFDMKNDQRLIDFIKTIQNRRTIIIVSHRPSYLRLCNRQFVFEKSRLIERDSAPFQ